MAELDFASSTGEFFAPASADMVDGLVGQYRAMRAKIEQVAAMITGETAGAVSYFLEGNGGDSRYGTPSVERLFQVDGAVAALNSAYWSKAMHLTDVLDAMPQKRRDEWSKQLMTPAGIKKPGRNDEWELPPLPDFEDETVRATLHGLLAQRHQFLAERVDGIFRGLSGEHVTNSPAAFGKRMIVGYVLNEYWNENHGKCGLINDLRCVIAKFMGRDEPGYSASSGLIRSLKGRWGEWLPVDGGALRIRLYRKGTAHIEVHPDMAWRLNAVLANLYPRAIPPEFRQRPKRKAKEFAMIQRPLPFAVVGLLAGMEAAVRMVHQPENWREPYRREKVENAVAFGSRGAGKHVVAETETVLASIGGVKTPDGWIQFDYDPREVLNEIVASGCIPDQKVHQFYPTPAAVAEAAIELAQIGPEHVCLEPSAGTGGLADLMPKDQTLCVEISKLHCQILAAKDYTVSRADFLAMPDATTFDRIVMNPPFSDGRWQAHIEHAATLLAEGGRLVAVLPASAKGKEVLPGFTCEWSRVFANEFAGTSVDVVILVATK